MTRQDIEAEIAKLEAEVKSGKETIQRSAGNMVTAAWMLGCSGLLDKEQRIKELKEQLESLT